MCGRYSLNLKDNKSYFKQETIDNFKTIFDYNNDNISPATEAPIILHHNSKYLFKQSKWGLLFDWLPKGKTLFNIRSETVQEKLFSNKLIVNNRCLVPFNYYFEWINTDTQKQKYKLYTKSQVGFFAALFSLVDNTYYFSILTKSSLESIKFIHKRNPVIINNSNIKQWFSNNYASLLGSSEDINYALSK
ncbi:SOS response-associated peptidase [Alphaproteobacteria bacterium]|nr:SOS response-associated peptidase [Alphaproteobacteria bacterium]